MGASPFPYPPFIPVYPALSLKSAFRSIPHHPQGFGSVSKPCLIRILPFSLCFPSSFSTSRGNASSPRIGPASMAPRSSPPWNTSIPGMWFTGISRYRRSFNPCLGPPAPAPGPDPGPGSDPDPSPGPSPDSGPDPDPSTGTGPVPYPGPDPDPGSYLGPNPDPDPNPNPDSSPDPGPYLSPDPDAGPYLSPDPDPSP